ncbi:MAG: sulfurtransferase [Pseudomonadota bacterium]
MRWIIAICAMWIVSFSGVFQVHAQPLVQIEWLQENLKNDNIVVLDIRSPRKSRDFYAEGHIEGAVSAPYNEGWRDTVNGVIGMLPPVEKISAHIGRLGVSNDSHVVIVPFGNSSTDFSAATRIYWTFKVLGHDRVSILEGGYSAWLAAGQRLSKTAVVPSQTKFEAKLQPHLIATEEDVHEAIKGGVSLVDARPKAQFEGKAKSPVVAKAGTIPQAMNLRQSTLYNPKSNQFLSEEGVNQSIAGIGIDTENHSIAFCNTGHWASIAWFALSEIAGKKNISLYDGSMAEWTAKEANPVQ